MGYRLSKCEVLGMIADEVKSLLPKSSGIRAIVTVELKRKQEIAVNVLRGGGQLLVTITMMKL
jgi:hypothetical protein